MSMVQFKDLAVDGVFTMNGIQYKKIPDIKISCCRSINATAVDNPNNKIQVQPLTEVEVNDQL
jgi:hypothetical protein